VSGDEHDPDGLELARALTRATAKQGGTPARRRKGKRPRAEQGRVSGAHPDDRDPQLLDATVERLVADHGWDLSLRVHGVFGRWPQIVGPELAEHTKPETFEDGVLVIAADSASWATQVRLLAANLVKRLNEDLGHGTVQRVKVVGPSGGQHGGGRLRVTGGRRPRP
jgi:predicted nucleic acid-binding Zn ribbon protein